MPEPLTAASVPSVIYTTASNSSSNSRSLAGHAKQQLCGKQQQQPGTHHKHKPADVLATAAVAGASSSSGAQMLRGGDYESCCWSTRRPGRAQRHAACRAGLGAGPDTRTACLR
jgi:hypothetical protein